jgi:outer membrane receptor protein involved in Fe transport
MRQVTSIACGVVLLPALAAAQTPPPPQPPVVSESVEVVATRIPEAPHEVPAAIEVILGDTLRATNARTLPQALALASGVDVVPGGDIGPAGSVPEFRGLREFDAFLLVVDGIPWGGAFNPALTTLNLRDVERVEILRGPAPVTFGATSFVGVIHVVHKPGTENARYVDVHAGSYGSGGGGVDLALPAFGSWQSRLTVDAERQGFSDDRTAYRRGHASWRAAASGSDRRSWLLADVNWLQQDPASPRPREGASLSPRVPVDANHNPADAFLNETRLSLSSGFERPLGAARWSTTASYSHAGQDIFRGFLADVADTADNARGLRETIDLNDIYADSHVAWPAHNNVTFIAGGDLLFGSGDAKGATFTYSAPLAGDVAPQVPEPSTLNLGIEDRRVFAGGYGLIEWRPNPKLTLSGGLRLNITFEERGGGEEEAQKAAGETDEGQTNVRPSGSAGALVTLWQRGANHVRAYGGYRSTFKPAAFDFGLGEEEGGEEEGLLEPETANNYEAGLKVRTLDGRLDAEADLFRLDFSNLVTSTVVGGLPALQNSGHTRFKGIELATDWHLPNAVTARVTYSFHSSTFTDFVQTFDGVPTQLAGKRLEMSPNHLFGGGLLYAPSRGWFGSVMAKYVGSRYLNKRNTALADAYATFDAGGGYRFDRYELRIDGRNLSDSRDPVAESELGDAQYYLMTARRVDVTFGMRF